MITNRKVSRKDYNVFLEGIHAAYGSAYGKIGPSIGQALRHYGLHLIKGELDHIEHMEKESDRSVQKKRRTVIFEPAPIQENQNDKD